MTGVQTCALPIYEKYQEAASFFEPIVLQQLPAEKLKEIWEKLNEQAGKFEKHTGTRSEKLKTWNVVYLTCKFERSLLDLKLVFTAENKITGIFFVPPKKFDYQLPSYAHPGRYTEESFTVHSDSFELPGTLTLPKGLNSFPLVVLVHGSGPNDRDETIANNKPFKDIALGLASRGIAVSRYDKRTFVYGKDSKVISMEDETTLDARQALLQAMKIPGARHIFILGHSQGAFDAPEIATNLKGLNGIIMMAGNARPLEDLILEQMSYILSQNGLSESEREELKDIKGKVSRVKNQDLNTGLPPDSLPLNIPAAYWLALRNYDPLNTAKKIKLPILILQGERDYQVTMRDFEIWKIALSEKRNVDFISYPKLNHLFMEGAGKSTPGEYLQTGHIPEYVIRDIADWVTNH